MALNCYNCANNLGNRCRHFGFVIGMHTCPHAEPIPPKTNADRIRSMTDEEIEKWFWWMHKEMMRYTDSRVFVHDWLRQEAKE